MVHLDSCQERGMINMMNRSEGICTTGFDKLQNISSMKHDQMRTALDLVKC